MPIATVRQLCTPNFLVTSDSLVEQVAQTEDFATGKIDGRDFFRHNHFTDGLERLVRRGFDRLAGAADDGAFYLTQAMGGGKTHSLIAFGLLASDTGLLRSSKGFVWTFGERHLSWRCALASACATFILGSGFAAVIHLATKKLFHSTCRTIL